MTDGYYYRTDGTAWFVGIIVALALLAIGYLVFSANSGPAEQTATVPQVECMIANQGREREQVTRWEPVSP